MSVLDEITAERRRQIAKGWTPEHDDGHTDKSIALAAACYAAPTTLYHGAPGKAAFREYSRISRIREPIGTYIDAVPAWPWPESMPQGDTRRERLIKAGALIVAEIERIDRAAAEALRYLEALQPGGDA